MENPIKYPDLWLRGRGAAPRQKNRLFLIPSIQDRYWGAVRGAQDWGAPVRGARVRGAGVRELMYSDIWKWSAELKSAELQ